MDELIAALGSAPVFVHAHPDDESISTGGAIAAVIAAGADPLVVTATRGERGEVMAGEYAPLEGTPALAAHRVLELRAALRSLGDPAHAFLGTAPARAAGLADRVYADSGMQWGADGFAEPAADAPADAFSLGPLDEATADLIAAAPTGSTAVVSYDARGGYGHPDHVRAHAIARALAQHLAIPFYAVVEPRVDPSTAGQGDRALELKLASPVLAAKCAAMAAHATQLRLDHESSEGHPFFTLTGGQRHPVGATETYLRLA